VQVPLALQPSALVRSQLLQATPLTPQAVTVGGVVQVLPVQQPVPQELASHTQAPPLQRWPAPQAAPEPHLHAPPVQLSALLRSQPTQALPASPQAAVEGLVQIFPLQQPVGQEVPSQMHWFPAQRWPAAQAGPAPQPHWPFAVQRSDVCTSQARQAPPSMPQALEVGLGLQLAP
jgi:hypothetical protein